VVTAGQRRRAVTLVCQRFSVSQRRACAVLGQPRSTQRYRVKVRDGEVELTKRLVRLAKKHPKYGVRRMTAVLRRDGRLVNRKRVERLWQAQGLQRPVRRKRRRNPAFPGSSANSCTARPATKPNDVWAWDFVHDRTADGRSFRWLTLIDEFTRECLLLHPARSLTGPKVTRELAKVVGRRGVPAVIRSDNGSEFIGQAIREWLSMTRVGTLFIAPGSPWENGYAESFHSRLRDEFLNDERFETVGEAKVKAQDWRHDFNTTRPHSALGYQTPQEAARRLRLGGVGSPCGANPHTAQPQPPSVSGS
jgi:putative transposase